ncbi:MAG: helix-turn-helix domain-containing protein [Candidatus Dormibacteria bacterium]
MLTVPELARRINRDPETVRRWIRTGRLRARRVGTQHVVDEADVADLLDSTVLRVPDAWTSTATGEPMPDLVAALRASRSGH